MKMRPYCVAASFPDEERLYDIFLNISVHACGHLLFKFVHQLFLGKPADVGGAQLQMAGDQVQRDSQLDYGADQLHLLLDINVRVKAPGNAVRAQRFNGMASQPSLSI